MTVYGGEEQRGDVECGGLRNLNDWEVEEY